MKSDTDLFSKIRIKPNKKKVQEETTHQCEWDGCTKPGTHKAPKGKNKEGQFHNYCLAHVREYNKTYNYFDGMGDGAEAAASMSSRGGERPTWKMGVNSWGRGERRRPANRRRNPFTAKTINDPHDLLDRGQKSTQSGPSMKERTVHKAELNAMETLGLDVKATKEDIKTRYKLLVRRNHPDTNGGDRSTEDRLREIIHAYNYLKNAGRV